MPSMSNLLAQAAGTSVDPAIRKKLGELLASQSGGAAAAPASAVPEPVDVLQQPARTPNGNMGRTLLEDPQPAANPQAAAGPKVKGFEETAGGKMAMSLLEKRKNLKWWMPDQFADRNERDMAQALDLARAEMGGTVAQSAADREERRLKHDSVVDVPKPSDRYKSVGGALFDTETRSWQTPPEQKDIGSGKRYVASGGGLYDTETKTWLRAPATPDASDRYKTVGSALYDTSSKTWVRPPKDAPYDPTAPDPGATGVFKDYAAKLLKDNPMIDPQDVPAEQVKASRLGILPKMMSRPSDRPASAGGPAAGAALNPVFQRDPRTGKLVRVR